MIPVTEVQPIQSENQTAGMVASKVNAILRAMTAHLKEINVPNIRLGKPSAHPAGWKTAGYAVYAQARGMVNADIVFGVDTAMAHKAVEGILSKRMHITDAEFRLALQMLANDALVSALDFLAQINLHISLTAPQVYSRFEWTKTLTSKLPMIEIPIITDSGVIHLAFHIG
ncbi:hypothetical protein HY522_04840 [bacterium]|nr:hypothetical protein [bacterium]